MTRGNAIAFWAFVALLWFAPLGTPHLFDPDEGRYAEIPREMVASGDWVTPRLDGIKYFEKPALQYWTTAIAYELFGEHAWSARAWSALCGFLGLLLTYALARRLYDARVALAAVLVQAGALLYLGLARITTLDMSLCFSLQIAMSALALLVHALGPRASAVRPGPGASSALPWLLGLGVALAVLSKGLVGILIPGAVGALFMLAYLDARLLLAARLWWTLLVLVVIAAPWFLLVSLRNPEFAHFFSSFSTSSATSAALDSIAISRGGSSSRCSSPDSCPGVRGYHARSRAHGALHVAASVPRGCC